MHVKALRLFAALALLSTATVSAQDGPKPDLKVLPTSRIRHRQARDRDVRCFIAYPEVKEKATTVIVIHESRTFGLGARSDGSTCEAGYIAIAPDLLSGMAPKGGGTEELGSGDEVRKVIRSLPPDQITADLDAVADYVTSCRPRMVNWRSEAFAGEAVKLSASPPTQKTAGSTRVLRLRSGGSEDIGRIECPVYGFYGENDARINAGIDQTKQIWRRPQKNMTP